MFGSRTLLLCGALAAAATTLKGQYAGSERCRTCHPDKFASQSKTGHAHALAKAQPGERGEWAFGAAEKARTWVSQIDADTYAEHGISYFTATHSTGLTPGHTDASDARYHTFDPEATVLRCFRCHSTGALELGANHSIQPGEAGIHCEACHGPGTEHIHSSGLAGTILDPRRLNGSEINDLCGTCHRNDKENDWTDKWKTRHQPTYLNQAACFRKSAGALSCVTCHDPHSALDRVSTHYDARCTACHKEVQHRTATAAKSCVECHMPQVTINSQLSFTNHWIGIYATGRYLVPARSVARNAAPLPVRKGTRTFASDAVSLAPVFEQVLTEQQNTLGPNDPAVARSASNLGRFLSKNGRPREAEAPLRQALQIDEARSAPETAGDRQNLADDLLALGKNEEAFALLQIAARGGDPEVTAKSLGVLARLDPANSEEYYRNAVEAEEKDTAKNTKAEAILLNNFAMALEEKKNYEQAEAAFRKALALEQKDEGVESPVAAATLSNLGSLLETVGLHAEAERMERQAIQIFEQKLGPRSAELATSCTNLADMLWTKGSRAEAAALYRRAISIDESVYGPENPEVGSDLFNYGSLLKASGQTAEARTVLARALAIFEKTAGPNSTQAAQVRKELE